MEKPKEPRLKTDSTMDYDLSERLVRQLQESRLHVYSTYVLSSLPEALATGGPEDEHSGLIVELAMLTDGQRGWLVLVEEDDEFDAAVELTELLGQVVGGAGSPRNVVVRGATMRHLDPCLRASTLDLRDPARVQDEAERAYEAAFGGAPHDVDHEALLSGLRKLGNTVMDERALRSFVAENG